MELSPRVTDCGGEVASQMNTEEYLSKIKNIRDRRSFFSNGATEDPESRLANESRTLLAGRPIRFFWLSHVVAANRAKPGVRYQINTCPASYVCCTYSVQSTYLLIYLSIPYRLYEYKV